MYCHVIYHTSRRMHLDCRICSATSEAMYKGMNVFLSPCVCTCPTALAPWAASSSEHTVVLKKLLYLFIYLITGLLGLWDARQLVIRGQTASNGAGLHGRQATSTAQ
jgi:hypothetical protein